MATECSPPDSRELAELWRLERLLNVGYEGFDAQRIAENHEIDLHEALALVEAGCRPELAARILL